MFTKPHPHTPRNCCKIGDDHCLQADALAASLLFLVAVSRTIFPLGRKKIAMILVVVESMYYTNKLQRSKRAGQGPRLCRSNKMPGNDCHPMTRCRSLTSSVDLRWSWLPKSTKQSKSLWSRIRTGEFSGPTRTGSVEVVKKHTFADHTRFTNFIQSAKETEFGRLQLMLPRITTMTSSKDLYKVSEALHGCYCTRCFSLTQGSKGDTVSVYQMPSCIPGLPHFKEAQCRDATMGKCHLRRTYWL